MNGITVGRSGTTAGPARQPGRVARSLDAIRRGIAAIDWRIWAIVLALVFCIILTLAGYAAATVFGVDIGPGTHVGAVFASWVGGVVLFSVAGAVVALVSIARPEQESFDARARILFRRQTGKHIDYIVLRIKDILEHYAESHEERLIIMGFHEGDRKFRIGTVSKAKVRSYIDDTETTYTSGIRLADVTPPPQGAERSKLNYLWVDDSPVEAPSDFDDAVERRFATRIERNSSCVIEHRLDIWLQADSEESTFEAVRYTQDFALVVENHHSQAIVIKLSHDDLSTPEALTVEAGAKRLVFTARDVEPGAQIYNYTVWLS